MIEAAKEIVASDLGPIEHVKFTLPADGGIVVFTGPQGVGKSTLIEASRSLISGGKAKMPVRDGAKAARIDAFGVTMRMGARASRLGELEVASIESRLTISDFVDPLIKDPELADNHRVKSLIQLLGVKADPALFYELFGGQQEYEAVVPTGEFADVVTLGGVVKRSTEKTARTLEEQYEHEMAHSKAKKEAAAGVDLEAESDSAVLQATLETAIRTLGELKERDKIAKQKLNEADTGREILAESEAKFDGLTVSAAEALVAARQQSVEEAKAVIGKITKQLEEASAHLKECKSELEKAEAQHKASVQHFATVEGWRKAIEDGAKIKPISPKKLAEASEAVETARAAMEQGVEIRKAQKSLEASKLHYQAAMDLSAKSHRLRAIAQGVDDVLSDCVAKAGTPLRVAAGRLKLPTDRGMECYGELSHGERWRVALDLVFNVVGEGAVIPVLQEAWEGTDIFNRIEINKMVKERKCWILTGQCSRRLDETHLQATTFEP